MATALLLSPDVHETIGPGVTSQAAVDTGESPVCLQAVDGAETPDDEEDDEDGEEEQDEEEDVFGHLSLHKQPPTPDPG